MTNHQITLMEISVICNLKRPWLTFLTCLILGSVTSVRAQDYTHSATLYGTKIYAFNGIPLRRWGKPLVYGVEPTTADTRTMGPLGGIPLVDIWNENGGVAIYNTTTYQEPFTVRLTYCSDHVIIEAQGGSNIEVFEHNGDYYEAVRAFALKMKDKGLSVQPAPEWAFDPIWETYGYQEDWTKDTVTNMVPLLKELGIKTITLDSGWYGEGRGDDWNAHTGDFNVNPDVIGSEQDFIDLIDYLHEEGFRVRIWWVPGVADKDTDLYDVHADWFYTPLVGFWSSKFDLWYLDPTKPEVENWNHNLIERFLSYGVDGFKQDGIWHIVADDPAYHQAYTSLICSNYVQATASKPDFVINTCNCGLAQNFYHMPGENQIITSDPVSAQQFRHRAKYLHALNVNGAAILGDHAELTKGPVGPNELQQPGFYNTVDFSSIVPLGMVYETKFRSDPAQVYRKWLDIYNTYKFYNMEWVNVPLIPGEIETYLMRDGSDLYFSFFTAKDNQRYEGDVTLSYLTPGNTYTVYDIVNEIGLGSFTATSDTHSLDLDFTHSLVIQVLSGIESKVPQSFVLFQNYPNPFNAITTIAYDLAEAADVTLTIYATTGQKVTTLIADHQEAGHHKVTWDGSAFANGIYFYRLEAEGFGKTRGMALIK